MVTRIANRFSLTAPQRGVLLMLGASFFFAFMSAISKWLSRDFHIVQLVFFRNIIGVLFIGTSILKRPMKQKGGRLGLLIFRGVVGTLSLYLLFYAIKNLGLGRASTYQYTYPIFLAFLSWLFLGEKLNLTEWIAIVLGFAGILFVFRPDLSMSVRNHVIGLGNALLTAVAYLAIRQLGQVYDTRAIVLSFMLSGIVLPIFSIIIGTYFPNDQLDFLIGTFKWPATWQHWLGFLAIGITAMIGQIMMTQSFTFDKAGRIAAVGYSNILFALVFGFLMREAVPTIATLVGMTLIISGGLLVSFSKDKIKK
ncbi:DMT family transporter [Dyadobacter sp. 3J3]|uniref:DMT family transporter n=1 Tax=Dyadobacter sp. 3J3 TaxID=2606600 RepID=UPI001E540D64|nr:DMT family transporter [Dyadobacter sp. 3J3]